jgi:guanylate kinase
MKGKIIIVGPGGSGKDYLRKKFTARGFRYGVSFTSRPPRDGEEDGVDYFFRDENFFEVNKDIFLEVQIFNGWYYGISKGEFEEKDLFILSPAGLRSLSKEDRERSMVIYLKPPEGIRIQRLSERNDADSLQRRIFADRKDFSDFCDYDIIITKEDF